MKKEILKGDMIRITILTYMVLRLRCLWWGDHCFVKDETYSVDQYLSVYILSDMWSLSPFVILSTSDSIW